MSLAITAGALQRRKSHQRMLDYDMDPDDVAAALRKSMPWLNDEDYDLAYEAANRIVITTLTMTT